MTTNRFSLKAGLIVFPLSILSAAISSSVNAQTENEQTNVAPADVERVQVVGRRRSAAEEIVVERLEADSVVDLLSADQIARVGDSNVADSLRRVPGLTLVDGKFVYVRGLGERYSSATLNGAAVPSPDLTRNVIPLDIFPAAIVESLSVQKGFSADQGAAFGGGAINIRTTSIPESFIAYVGTSAGINSISDEHIENPSGSSFGDGDSSRQLSSTVLDVLGSSFVNGGDFDLSANAIQQTSVRNGSPISLAEADLVNSQLATAFDRNLDITEGSRAVQDWGISGGIGDAIDFGTDFVLGGLVTLNYGESLRTQDRTIRRLEEPDEEFIDQTKSTENSSLTVTAGAALSWGTEHTIESKNFFIRNTDDETFLSDEYNDTSGFSSGNGFRNYRGVFEQRELEIYQLSGRHQLGDDTLDLLGLGDSFLTGLELNWFYSDSTATTEIPNSFTAVANFDRDVESGEISNVNLALGGIASNGLQFENLDLDDQLESSGFDLKLPLYAGDWLIEVSGGARSDRRARISTQLNFTIDGNSTNNAFVTDSISERFSDENILNPDLGFELALQNTDFGPSVAATQVDAAYGQIDFDWNGTLYLVAGVRYEDYRQVSALFNPLALNSPIFPNLDINEFAATGDLDGAFQQDDYYPSVAVKYSLPDFWAETFNLRLSWSETTVRPDLREIVDTSYRDPVTDFIITGNSGITPSDITNLDFRSEWYFDNGDNFTVSLFHKDIENPIEILAQTTSGNELRGQVLNVESAEIAGVEVEWLVNLDFLGDIGSQFFVQGNLTGLFTNEINVGDIAVNVTNRERELTQASDFVANIIVGFDSKDGKHSAGLAFNTFSERLFISGEGGRADSFEQPFDSLDLTYTYFITDYFNVKFKARNLLDDFNEITQADDSGSDVVRFEQEVGQSYSVSFRYQF
ncbi:TonB-dependent receptor [Alteromonas sp. 5E99-2]|uniref:TonB-dependent receptor domain-containing protein n=1 Tax=Alteromonas sp. 5E99-2 TaxID=2817683 RepID=UPI001A99D4D4|nr:TonB-dependent receptor [Alteromonas sp. 5E99-2]MBO1254446.1 TonB-dependent receptor [Alteromonas sp. 5E99-2]